MSDFFVSCFISHQDFLIVSVFLMTVVFQALLCLRLPARLQSSGISSTTPTGFPSECAIHIHLRACIRSLTRRCLVAGHRPSFYTASCHRIFIIQHSHRCKKTYNLFTIHSVTLDVWQRAGTGSATLLKKILSLVLRGKLLFLQTGHRIEAPLSFLVLLFTSSFSFCYIMRWLSKCRKDLTSWPYSVNVVSLLALIRIFFILTT